VTTERKLQQVINAEASSDGDGVRIRRIAGRQWFAQLDPFLLLDEIRSTDGADYIGGFPSHPHRGIETITYMLDGAMRHRDHLGNEGVIRSGDVQWMTAGRGVIHSEMPEQTDGLLHGFQLWLNLPVAEKMRPAGYQDYRSDELPIVELSTGGRIKVIAGNVGFGHDTVRSPMTPTDRVTRPVILDVALRPGERWTHTIDSTHTLLVRVFEGATTDVSTHQMGIYVSGDALTLTASGQGARALVLAGAPLREPVWQHGPFVMNTRAEIETAIRDYSEGRLVA
jgi:hypothetical protein